MKIFAFSFVEKLRNFLMNSFGLRFAQVTNSGGNLFEKALEVFRNSSESVMEKKKGRGIVFDTTERFSMVESGPNAVSKNSKRWQNSSKKFSTKKRLKNFSQMTRLCIIFLLFCSVRFAHAEVSSVRERHVKPTQPSEESARKSAAKPPLISSKIHRS